MTEISIYQSFIETIPILLILFSWLMMWLSAARISFGLGGRLGSKINRDHVANDRPRRTEGTAIYSSITTATTSFGVGIAAYAFVTPRAYCGTLGR